VVFIRDSTNALDTGIAVAIGIGEAIAIGIAVAIGIGEAIAIGIGECKCNTNNTRLMNDINKIIQNMIHVNII